MGEINILDCTLRDGGYINQWNFGKEGIENIISGLEDAGIRNIECGFLKNNINYNSNFTLYDSINRLKNTKKISKYTFMVNIGEYNLKLLSRINENIEIRVSFKKSDLTNIIEYIKPLQDLNIKFSLNAMHICLYGYDELKELIVLANSTKANCLTAVDTMGIMSEKNLDNIFKLFDKYLDNNISVGLHSHNNMNHSLKNAISLINMDLDRDIIIDSAIGGISRGAGILDTENICELLNNNYDKNFDLTIIEELKTKYLNQILNEYNSIDKYPYYLSAKYKCHPNYAKFLADKKYSNGDIEKILKLIPDKYKINYCENLIYNLIT